MLVHVLWDSDLSHDLLFSEGNYFFGRHGLDEGAASLHYLRRLSPHFLSFCETESGSSVVIAPDFVQCDLLGHTRFLKFLNNIQSIKFTLSKI